MLRTRISLSYVAGDHIRLRFTVTDQAGTPANITGSTARFAAARRPGMLPVLSTEGSPPTATAALTSPAAGVFEVVVAGEDTQALRGSYEWQAEVEDASGDRATVAEGVIDFARDLIPLLE